MGKIKKDTIDLCNRVYGTNHPKERTQRIDSKNVPLMRSK